MSRGNKGRVDQRNKGGEGTRDMHSRKGEHMRIRRPLIQAEHGRAEQYADLEGGTEWEWERGDSGPSLGRRNRERGGFL